MYNLTTWIAFLTFLQRQQRRLLCLRPKILPLSVTTVNKPRSWFQNLNQVIGLYILRVAALLLPPIRIENAKKDINNQPQVKTMV